MVRCPWKSKNSIYPWVIFDCAYMDTGMQIGKHPDFTQGANGRQQGQCRWGSSELTASIEVFVGGERHSDDCPNSNWARDSTCDRENNIPGCYDLGDCCETTCSGYRCGSRGFDCNDPAVLQVLNPLSSTRVA